MPESLLPQVRCLMCRWHRSLQSCHAKGEVHEIETHSDDRRRWPWWRCSVILIAAAGCKIERHGRDVTRPASEDSTSTIPKDLPERGEDNIDIVLSNRGVNNVQDILARRRAPAATDRAR